MSLRHKFYVGADSGIIPNFANSTCIVPVLQASGINVESIGADEHIVEEPPKNFNF